MHTGLRAYGDRLPKEGSLLAKEINQYLREMHTSREALVASERLAAVGRLSASISHEINNPLESVMNLMYLIGTRPDLPPDLRPSVTLAEDELKRVARIANHTLRTIASRRNQ
jgi:signal transduction histidine kinase